MGPEAGPGPVVFLALVCLCFAPLIADVVREVPDVRSIGVINHCLGWTLLGVAGGPGDGGQVS